MIVHCRRALPIYQMPGMHLMCYRCYKTSHSSDAFGAPFTWRCLHCGAIQYCSSLVALAPGVWTTAIQRQPDAQEVPLESPVVLQ